MMKTLDTGRFQILLSAIILLSTSAFAGSETGNCKPKLNSQKLAEILEKNLGQPVKVGIHDLEETPDIKLQNFVNENFGNALNKLRDLHGQQNLFQANIGFKMNGESIAASCEVTYRYWQSQSNECSHRVAMNCPKFTDSNNKSVPPGWVDDQAAKNMQRTRVALGVPYKAPRPEMISKLEEVWKELIVPQESEGRATAQQRKAPSSSADYQFENYGGVTMPSESKNATVGH